MLDWTYSGVDFSLAGNGGPECIDYLSKSWLFFETLAVFAFSATFEIYYPWYKSVCNYQPNLELRERFGRKLLLAALCLIWGIEIGFKLSTQQLIFILNPCHMITLTQLILLISPPRRWVHFLFRVQTYAISGATVAIIFPVLNTRHLPFEVASYYIHHALMLITPFYLMRLGGIYNMEPLKNWHWLAMSMGILRFYHYGVLQPISILTSVNLNSIMCPAVSDPFKGPFYRIAACFHQTAFVAIHGKITCFIGMRFFAPKEKGKEMLTDENSNNYKVKDSYENSCNRNTIKED